ncbi:MAG: hypothetical protein U1E76_09220 [Planctomycetota bacterium]
MNEQAWVHLKRLALDERTMSHALILRAINRIFRELGKPKIAKIARLPGYRTDGLCTLRLFLILLPSARYAMLWVLFARVPHEPR